MGRESSQGPLASLPLVVTAPHRINTAWHKYITTLSKGWMLAEVGLQMPVGGLAEDVRLDIATDENSEDLFLYKRHISILLTRGNMSGNTEHFWGQILKVNCVGQQQESASWEVTFTLQSRKDLTTMRCWSNASIDRIKPMKALQLIVANCRHSESKRHEADRPKWSRRSCKLAGNAKFLWPRLKH